MSVVAPSTNACVICLEDIVSELQILLCGHRYHFNCIILWLWRHSTCPYCRINVRNRFELLYQDYLIQYVNTNSLIFQQLGMDDYAYNTVTCETQPLTLSSIYRAQTNKLFELLR